MLVLLSVKVTLLGPRDHRLESSLHLKKPNTPSWEKMDVSSLQTCKRERGLAILMLLLNGRKAELKPWTLTSFARQAYMTTSLCGFQACAYVQRQNQPDLLAVSLLVPYAWKEVAGM